MIKIILATIMLLLGIILLYYSLKQKNKEKIKIQNTIEKIKGTPEEKFKKILTILKEQIKEQYKINDKLSLKEIITELEKKDSPFFLQLCKEIEPYIYQKKEKNKTNYFEKKLLEEIKKKDEYNKKQKELKKKKETLIEKLANKERELHEKIRIEKIKHKKLKKIKPKISNNPTNKENKNSQQNTINR